MCSVPAHLPSPNTKTRKFRSSFSKGNRGGDDNVGTQQDQKEPSDYEPPVSSVHLGLSDYGYS